MSFPGEALRTSKCYLGGSEKSIDERPGPRCYPSQIMDAKGLTPILNVSDIAASFAWFEKWGWEKVWDWGTPPTFGAVRSGVCQIFLCQGAQGGRGRGTRARGCRCGWKTLTPSIKKASPPGWMSPFRRRTCRGKSARCIYGLPMDMCFASAGGSSARSK
jgi:hypothetical protein